MYFMKKTYIERWWDDNMLTVILPSLNVVQYIGQCLTSVINQSYMDLEIICVDAGSTDGTLDIIKQYADSDKRVRIINCDEKSYGYQVNIAMDNAQGRYVAIVDTDDFVALDMYINLVNLAEKYNLDYIKTDYVEYYQFESNNIYEHKKSIISERDLYNKIINPKEYPQLHCEDGYLWCGIYNMEFIRKNKIRFNTTKGAAFQDVGFFHQVTYYANRVMYTDVEGYYYRISRIGNSISSPNGLKYMLQEYKRLICEKLIPVDDRIQWKYIYKKMILSLVAECDKDAIYMAFEHENIRPYLEEAVKLIKENIGYLKKIDFHEKYWNKVWLLLDDHNEFAKKQYEKECAIKSLMNVCKIHNRSDQNPRIVVFGCGLRGKRIEEILMKRGIKVSAFVDNDMQKVGSVIDGVEVVSLENEMLRNTLYVISIKGYYNDVKEQLLSQGIQKNKIYIPDMYIWI